MTEHACISPNLEARVEDMIASVCSEGFIDCDDVRCTQCPFDKANTHLAARGFIKEVLYSRLRSHVQELEDNDG